MISIYDVLKASKGLPVRDPIACHWGRKLGGGAAGYDELTGTPPLTFTANGRNLINYRIYGSSDGVGEQTENLLNPNEMEPGYYISSGSLKINNNNWNLYYVPVTPLGIYTAINLSPYISSAYIGFCDENRNIIGRLSGAVSQGQRMIEIPGNCYYLAVSVRVNAIDPMLTEGSTAPAQYIPFGYQINAEVGDGATTTDTPIYIGDAPLAQGEYVDYGEQKVYKYVGGVLTPTEPPVALPALPTIDGATIVDFDNTPKPSEVYIKYPK